MTNKLSRRSFNLLGAGAALGGRWVQSLIASPGSASADAAGRAIFPFGTHVYREPHLPLEQFRHDFPILKRLGFTMIKIQEVWANDEPAEGEIDLSNVSQVVSDARQNGLRVYFGVTMENAPAWLWKKWPDASMVYETGEPHNDPTQYVLPVDGKPGPCWYHPGARMACIRFIETVGREIGRYDNIEVWNVWQEIGFWSLRPGHLGVCYCHNTLPQFRQWLRTKYSTLGNLNHTWKTSYSDWGDIDPPRFSAQVPPFIDWRYFMDDVYLSEVLKFKGDAFRRSDPLHRPILAHVAGPTYGGASEWRYGETLDILGSSCYPGGTEFNKWDINFPAPGKAIPRATGLSHELWEGVMMRFDYLRSAKRDGEIWTAELQSGPIIEGLNRHQRIPDAADSRRWVLGCLAAGVRGICFWNHRPEIFWQEGYGFGLLDWDSDTSPRAGEAGRLSRAINEHSDLFSRGRHPQPQIAMMVSEDLFHFTEADPSEANKHLVYTIRGIYKALWDEAFPISFVNAEALPDTAEQVKVLVVPFPVALSSEVIGALQNYVRNGGTVISEACAGRFSNYGMAFKTYMAPGLQELFGVGTSRVARVAEPGDGAKWTGSATTYGDLVEFGKFVGQETFSAFSISPAYYIQTLKLTSAMAIFKFGGEVTGCVNAYGKGRAYLIGTLLGHAGLAYNDSTNRALLASMMASAGVLPDHAGKLKRRRRALGGKEAWFLFNTTSDPIEESVSLGRFTSVQDLLGKNLVQSDGSVRVKVDPLDIKCLIVEA